MIIKDLVFCFYFLDSRQLSLNHNGSLDLRYGLNVWLN